MKKNSPLLAAGQTMSAGNCRFITRYPFTCLKNIQSLLLFLLMLVSGMTARAQFTATWALTTDGSNVIAGAQSANLSAGLMDPFYIVGTGNYGTNGFGIQTTRANWATSASDNFRLDFPINPAPGYDINLSTLRFNARTSGGSGNSAVELAYQVNGSGPWIPVTGTPAFPHLFNGSSTNYNGTLNLTLTSGNTYVLRMYVYWATSGSSQTTNRTNTIGQVILGGTAVVSGPPPNVTTTGSSNITRTTATASGSITPVISAVTESGICWSTVANPTTADNKAVTNPLVSSGAFDVNLTGLNAGTTYHYRAYAINGVGTSYGADLTFTTAPPVLPTVLTTAVNNITAVSARSGGDVTDEGGAAVTQRGIVWNTTGSPVISADPFTVNGTGAGSFAANAQVLNASTTYFARAYATNSVGTAYGNEISFTTLAPTPTLLVSPDSLGFGTVLQGAVSTNQTFTVSGYYLLPASGNITLVAPPGYRISLSAGSGFASTLQLSYSNGTLANTTVYVRFSPTALANYNKSISVTGGDAPAVQVKLTGNIEPVGGQGQQGFSNKGKEFWVGYGAHEQMTGNNSQDLRFVFNNPNPVDANVTISIPNLPAFTPLTYVVPANSVITTNPNEIPEGVDPALDARLRSEGVFNAGILIQSNVDIVAYAHNVASQVYAATLLFPTNTLGREYTSLNFTQRFNSGNSTNRSYCFAIATEDNTLLEVVLPPDVATETHAAGSTFTQVLNRGEILNLFGTTTGGETGIDMSGVVVRSLSGTTGCKPFAFFCGAGKITIDCSTNPNVSGSGDNLFQQMFPKVAWGFKYIVVPTEPAAMNIGHVRVLVDDPATVVKRNGVVLTGLTNSYYEYLNSEKTVDVIEADKPVMVAQYMTTDGQCGNPSSPVGDPEMIYLSSVQQTIDTVALVSSPLGNSSGRQHFINVVLKTADAPNFLLDGGPVSFNPVTNDPSGIYSYAQIPVAQSSHVLTCPGGFNAIAYGVAGDESYGYNAGTNLVDLFSGFNVQNQFASGASVAACRGSEFFMKVTLAFKPLSIVWDFSNNPNLTPNTSVTQTAADLSLPNVLVDSFVINGVQLYTYQIPTTYIYNALGSFDVKITATSPTPDGCNGIRQFTFPVTVDRGPLADFTFPPTNGCFGTVQFTDASQGNGGTIDTWQWNFGDNPAGTSTQQSPSYTYTTGGSFNVKLRVITEDGCYADTTRTITFSGVPQAGYTVAGTRCVNSSLTFTNTSTVNSGSIVQWTWNFGDNSQPVVATTGAAQTHTYAQAGTYTVTLTVVTGTGCTSVPFEQTIIINGLPQVSLSLPNASVCNTTPAFTLTGGTPATASGQGTGVYTGAGVAEGQFNPAQAGVGTHPVTYTYTTEPGCVGSAVQSIVVNPAVTLTINPVAALCVNDDPVTLTANQPEGIFSGPGVTGSSFNPAQAGAGTFNITYSIPTNSCTVPASLTVTVNPAPTDFSAGSDVEGIFGRSATITGSGPAEYSYLWSPATFLNSATNLVTVSTATETTNYTLTATNSFGCSATDEMTLTVSRLCIDPPNVFTPNGDGFYDKWVVINGSCTKIVKVSVFNRWGGRVYENDRYANEWDGTYKGKQLPDGTYYYIVEARLNNGESLLFRGNVTIMR